jgi:hypothetical protein
MTAWLDENCGADGWAMTPSGMRGVLNDAVSIYFLDPTLAGAFVAGWCAGSAPQTHGGLFRMRIGQACIAPVDRCGFAHTGRERPSGRVSGGQRINCINCITLPKVVL